MSDPTIARAVAVMPITTAQIERVSTVKEAAKIKGIADAAQVFYKAQEDLVMSQRAKEISFRSARRAGQILLPVPRSDGGRPKNSLLEKRVTPYQEALDGTGITPFIAHTWQKLAEIPDDIFEKYITDAKFANTEFTINGLLRYEHASNERARHKEWCNVNKGCNCGASK